MGTCARIPYQVFTGTSSGSVMKLDLDIGGMTCLDCSTHVSRALERVTGVAAARIDYRAGRGTVELAPGAARTAELEQALVGAVERAGYRATVAEGDGSASAAASAAPPIPVIPPASGRSDTPSFASGVAARPVALGRRVAATEPGDGQLRRDGQAPAPGADFDVLVVGTGGAGVAAAIQVAGMGAKVAIVEGGTLGGTCVNVGCIPSKNLIEAASHYHAARRGFPGVAPCEPALDWSAVVRAKDALVAELRQAKYADVLASYPGVARLDGRARLLASADGLTRVRVGNREHTARKVILATGTAAAVPPLPGIDEVEALDSTSAMALDALPASMIVLGGGPVGVELGQTFARFGVQVTLVQRGPHLLPGEDPTISEVLREALEAEGIEIHTGAEAIRVERAGGDGEDAGGGNAGGADAGVVVHVRQGRLEGQLRAERLLVATGRLPNTRDLGLEEVGVALSPRGFVQVDTTMRTSNPHIYAAGDVTGGPGYVYVAAAGGRVAAENAMKSLAPTGTASDDPREFDVSVVPSVTFTSPQVGSVGLTEAAARAAGYHVDVSVLDMGQVPRALVAHDHRGMVKIVAETGSGKILGVHAVAPNAGEFMGEATLAVRFGLTARDLSGTLHPYLTWVESLKLAAQGFAMDISKLSCCA